MDFSSVKNPKKYIRKTKQSWSWILLIKWINVESSGEDGQSIRQKQFGGSFYILDNLLLNAHREIAPRQQKLQ